MARERDDGPIEVLAPPGPRKYWTRRGVAIGLEALLSEDVPTIVGIDRSFFSRCDISRRIDWNVTGTLSLKISKGTGQRTGITSVAQNSVALEIVGQMMDAGTDGVAGAS